VSNNRSESELAGERAAAPRLRIYTTPWCGDCRMAKAVLDRVGLGYEEINIDHDPEAVAT
jgi:mycoredoxin